MSQEVFISYSHDSAEHIDRVLALSNRLRADGIDCVLDQYEECPPEGWPRWMDRKIRDAQFVLMICTPIYYKRVMGDELPGQGHGVRWEGNLIYQHIYNAGTSNTKFIPVLLDGATSGDIPVPLQATTAYRLDGEFLKLYARLTGQKFTPKPTLGSRKPLPSKEVKTDPKMFLVSPIDVELWNAARWKATFYLFLKDSAGPPTIGLAFRDREAGRAIFQGWHDRYGARDEYEELRISIVEWDDLSPGTHYTVHISADPSAAEQRNKQHGYEAGDLMLMISRHNQMEPESSKNLDMFKKEYRRHKTYFLAPGWISEDNKDLEAMPELALTKGKISFVKASEVGPNDPDMVVIGKYRSPVP